MQLTFFAIPPAVDAAGALGVHGELVPVEHADLEVGVKRPPHAVLVAGALL